MSAGFVYFCGYDNNVKIGKSIDPEGRVDAHNGSNPNEIKLLAVVKSADMGALETKLHKYFKREMVWGKREWFARSATMNKLIDFINRTRNASDFDIGVFLGMVDATESTALYDSAVDEIAVLKRHIAVLAEKQRELWVLDGVIQSLNLRTYPVFQDRYVALKTQMEDVDEDEAPVFIWKSDGSVTVVSIQDNRIIFPIPYRIPEGYFDDQDAA